MASGVAIGRRSLSLSSGTRTCHSQTRLKRLFMTFISCFRIPCIILPDKMRVLELDVLRKATERNSVCSEPRQAESGSSAGAHPVVPVYTRRMRSTSQGEWGCWTQPRDREGSTHRSEWPNPAWPEPRAVSGTLVEVKGGVRSLVQTQ